MFLLTYTFTPGHQGFIGILIAFAIANSIGLIQYIWAVRITQNEHLTPFPAWVHAFFFGHDFTGACVFISLAFKYDNFWLFWVYGAGLLTWTVMELMNMRTTLLYEREEAFGHGTTQGQALLQMAMMVALMFTIVELLRHLTGDVAMFIWLPITNLIMAIAPGLVLNARQSRKGSSVFINIMVLVGTIFNFLPAPLGLFTTVLPQIYNQPVWFAMGAVATLIAAYNLYRIIQLPPKEKIPGGETPIW